MYSYSVPMRINLYDCDYNDGMYQCIYTITMALVNSHYHVTVRCEGNAEMSKTKSKTKLHFEFHQ